MGWLSIIMSVLAVFLYYNDNSFTLMWITIGVALVNLWSFGVMHNYASRSSVDKIKQIRENAILKNDDEAINRSFDLKPSLNPNAIPNWLSTINLIFTLITLGLLIYAFF